MKNNEHGSGPKIPSQIGRHQSLKLQGTIDLATHYKAVNVEDNTDSWILGYPPKLQLEKDAYRLLLDEVNILRSVRHPALLPIQEVKNDDSGTLYLCYSHLEGFQTLDTLLGKLNDNAILFIFSTIVEILQLLHENGLQASLRPSQIYFQVQSTELYILRPPQQYLSQLNVDLLTPIQNERLPYWAPEQIDNKETNLQADYFTLGTMLFEALTGKAAFRRSLEFDTKRLLLEGLPPTFSSNEFPKSLKSLLLSLMEKTQERRLTDPLLLKERLHQIFDPNQLIPREENETMPSLSLPAALPIARQKVLPSTKVPSPSSLLSSGLSNKHNAEAHQRDEEITPQNEAKTDPHTTSSGRPINTEAPTMESLPSARGSITPAPFIPRDQQPTPVVDDFFGGEDTGETPFPSEHFAPEDPALEETMIPGHISDRMKSTLARYSNKNTTPIEFEETGELVVPDVSSLAPQNAPAPQKQSEKEKLSLAETQEYMDTQKIDDIIENRKKEMEKAGKHLPAKKRKRLSSRSILQGNENTLLRKSVVRHYTQMNPGKIYPLLVSILQDNLVLQQPNSRKVKQIQSDQTLSVDAQQPFLRIVPIVPGCIITPAEAIIDASDTKVDTTFWLTPQCEADLMDSAHIQVWHKGKLLDQIDIPCVIKTQFFTKLAASSSVIASIAGAVLQTYSPKENTSVPEGIIPYIVQNAVELLSSWGIWLGLILLVLTGVLYFVLRPKHGDEFEHILDTSD